MTLQWSKEPSYYFGRDDAEYAWIEGSRDFHWAVDGGVLAVFDNEYDRSMVLSSTNRTQEETKAVAQRLQDGLEGKTKPTTALEWTEDDDHLVSGRWEIWADDTEGVQLILADTHPRQTYVVIDIVSDTPTAKTLAGQLDAIINKYPEPRNTVIDEIIRRLDEELLPSWAADTSVSLRVVKRIIETVALF